MVAPLLAAALLDGQVAAFGAMVASTAALGVFLAAVTTWIPREGLRVGLLGALTVFLVAGLACGVVAPEAGIEQGRLRGLAENANGLGCYAFALGALALTVVGRRSVALVLLSISGASIAWAGSRNSALALGAVAVVVLVARSSWRARIPCFLALVAVVISYELSGNQSVSFWLSTRGNTRGESYTYAIHVLELHPWSGIGLGNEIVEVASSPMRAIAHAGLWGALAVVAMWAGVLGYGLTTGVRTAALSGAVVVFSLFEGVLLSPIGPFLLVLLSALVAVQRNESAEAYSRWATKGDADRPPSPAGHL